MYVCLYRGLLIFWIELLAGHPNYVFFILYFPKGKNLSNKKGSCLNIFLELSSNSPQHMLKSAVIYLTANLEIDIGKKT